MKKTLLFILFILLNTVAFSQITQDIVQRPSDFEFYSAPDSLGKRTFLESALSKNANAKIQSSTLRLPYPILFIHGLGSNAETWKEMIDYLELKVGLKNGGRFDYCLNYNGNNATANTNFYPTIAADIAVFSGTWATFAVVCVPHKQLSLCNTDIETIFANSPIFSPLFVSSKTTITMKHSHRNHPHPAHKFSSTSISSFPFCFLHL